MFYGHSGDHAVDSLANRYSAPAQGSVDLGGPYKGSPIQIKKKERVESRQCPGVIGVFSDALQDFGENHPTDADIIAFDEEALQHLNFM